MFSLRLMVLHTLFLIIFPQSNPVAWNNFVLVANITHSTLMGPASRALNTTYLSKFIGKPQKQYQGIFFGNNQCPLVSMPVRFSHKFCKHSINIFFEINTNTVASTLTIKALRQLSNVCPEIQVSLLDSYSVIIGGHKTIVQQSVIANTLGANYLSETNSHVEFDYKLNGNGTFKIVLSDSNMIKQAKNKKKKRNK